MSHETTLPQPVNYIADEWTECTPVDDAWNLDPNTRTPVHRTALFSRDGRFRYRLGRRWADCPRSASSS